MGRGDRQVCASVARTRVGIRAVGMLPPYRARPVRSGHDWAVLTGVCRRECLHRSIVSYAPATIQVRRPARGGCCRNGAAQWHDGQLRPVSAAGRPRPDGGQARRCTRLGPARARVRVVLVRWGCAQANLEPRAFSRTAVCWTRIQHAPDSWVRRRPAARRGRGRVEHARWPRQSRRALASI